jgi:hypothetical protein
MLEAIKEAIKLHTETLEFAGRKVLVRELMAEEALPVGDMAKTPEDLEKQQELAFMLMFVRSIVWADGEEQGQRVFTDEDIPDLEKGSKRRIAPLVAAVSRVNGLDAVANAKK